MTCAEVTCDIVEALVEGIDTQGNSWISFTCLIPEFSFKTGMNWDIRLPFLYTNKIDRTVSIGKTDLFR